MAASTLLSALAEIIGIIGGFLAGVWAASLAARRHKHDVD